MKLKDIVDSQEPSVTPIAIATMEAIAFQRNDKFGPNIEAIVTKFMELVDKGIDETTINSDIELKKELTDVIKARLGITVALICDGVMVGCIPNVYTEHSAVVRDEMRGVLLEFNAMMGITDLLVKKSGAALGTVNTETAKLTGWFSEQVIPLYVNFNELKENNVWTAPEITGIILHELGHIFESAAKCFTINNANQVISDIAKHISSKDRGGDIEYVYLELKKIDSDIERSTVEALNTSNGIVFGMNAFKITHGVIRSLSGSRTYDRTSQEALADSFAVRFGYGKYLAEGFDKSINTGFRKLTQAALEVSRVTVSCILVTSIVSMLAALFTGGPAALGMFGLYRMIMSAMAMFRILQTNRHSTFDYEYDEDPDRINRIRMNLIEQLKDPQVPKATKLATLEQIKVATAIHKRTYTVPNIIQKVMTILTPADRNSYKSTQVQKQLEQLIGNELFVKSNELSLKA